MDACEAVQAHNCMNDSMQLLHQYSARVDGLVYNYCDLCYRFDAFMREMDTRFPTTDTVFEYCVDPNQRGWLSWENKLSSGYRYADPLPHTISCYPINGTARE